MAHSIDGICKRPPAPPPLDRHHTTTCCVTSSLNTTHTLKYHLPPPPRRCLTAVYQLHAASINSLCVGEGLVLTASDDTTLRLWPLDFSAFLLEAQHEAPVTSACLGSTDGLLLVAGCEDGSLGQLDVVSRQHRCLLRSHCGAVQSLATHPNR